MREGETSGFTKRISYCIKISIMQFGSKMDW